MACKSLHLSLLLLIVLTAPVLMFAQSETSSARSVLHLSTADQIAFLNSAIDAGFPVERADEMTMLVINRSEIAVPIILGKLEKALSSHNTTARFVDTAVETIAYAGNEHAILAIARLLSVDEKRFGRYVGRTLDNAANWRNPFGVAYRALDMSDSRIAELTMKWVEAGMNSPGRQRQWAEALLEKHGRIPTESDWAHDPIASRLSVDKASGVKDRVLDATLQVQRLREKRQ